MGKWGKPRVQGGGGGGGGGHGDVSSCRGHGVILGTCDTARERETNVELIRLLNLAIEDLEGDGTLQRPQSSGGDSSESSSSIADLIAAEVRQAKVSQAVTSVNTNTKGVVLIKISERIGRSGGTPIVLLRAIFDRISRTKQSGSKHICRLIPFCFSFFPNEDELQTNTRLCLRSVFPNIALPEWVCRKHLIFERERLKEEKRKADRLKKEARQAAFDARNKAKEGDGEGEGEGGGANADADADADADAEAENGSEEENDEGVDVKEEGVGHSVGDKRPRAALSTEAVGTEAPLDSAASVPSEEVIPPPKEVKVEKGPGPEPQSEPEPEPESEPVSVAYPPFTYYYNFTARNHDVLNRRSSFSIVGANMPSEASPALKNSQYVLSLEIFKNLGGLSLLPSELLDTYMDFNLRKFTAHHTETAAGGES